MLLRTCTRVTRSIYWTRLPVQRNLHIFRPAVAIRPQASALAIRRCVGDPARSYSTGRSSADEIIEEITEQYSTTKDEFEIAVEETEKNTVYAPEDRAAAAEEMEKLKEMYNAALAENPEQVANDIKRRIGQRIRELDEAIKGLEESAHQES